MFACYTGLNRHGLQAGNSPIFIINQHWNENKLYDALLGRAYLDNIFLVAWMDKPTLVSKLSPFSLSNSTWQFSGSARQFWKCSIDSSHKPAELIQYLKAHLIKVNNLNFRAA